MFIRTNLSSRKNNKRIILLHIAQATRLVTHFKDDGTKGVYYPICKRKKKNIHMKINNATKDPIFFVMKFHHFAKKGK